MCFLRILCSLPAGLSGKAKGHILHSDYFINADVCDIIILFICFLIILLFPLLLNKVPFIYFVFSFVYEPLNPFVNATRKTCMNPGDGEYRGRDLEVGKEGKVTSSCPLIQAALCDFLSSASRRAPFYNIECLERVGSSLSRNHRLHNHSDFEYSVTDGDCYFSVTVIQSQLAIYRSSLINTPRNDWNGIGFLNP